MFLNITAVSAPLTSSAHSQPCGRRILYWSKYLNDKPFVNFFLLDWNMVISGNHESQYFDWKFWKNIFIKMSRCRLLTPQVMTVSLGDLRGRESPPDWEPLSLLPIFGLPSSLVTQLTEPAQPDGDSSLINLNHLSQWRLKSVRQFILSSPYFPILPFLIFERNE